MRFNYKATLRGGLIVQPRERRENVLVRHNSGAIVGVTIVENGPGRWVYRIASINGDGVEGQFGWSCAFPSKKACGLAAKRIENSVAINGWLNGEKK